MTKAHSPPSMVGLVQSAEGLNRTKRPMLLLLRGTASCLTATVLPVFGLKLKYRIFVGLEFFGF